MFISDSAARKKLAPSLSLACTELRSELGEVVNSLDKLSECQKKQRAALLKDAQTKLEAALADFNGLVSHPSIKPPILFGMFASKHALKSLCARHPSMMSWMDELAAMVAKLEHDEAHAVNQPTLKAKVEGILKLKPQLFLAQDILKQTHLEISDFGTNKVAKAKFKAVIESKVMGPIMESAEDGSRRAGVIIKKILLSLLTAIGLGATYKLSNYLGVSDYIKSILNGSTSEPGKQPPLLNK
jgi:hypothetical protein